MGPSFIPTLPVLLNHTELAVTLKYQEIGNCINIDALLIYYTVYVYTYSIFMIYLNTNTGDFFLNVLFFFYKMKKS